MNYHKKKSEKSATARRVTRTNERQDDADDIEVEEQFWQCQFIGLSTAFAQIIWHQLQSRAQPAEGEHKHKESAILCDGGEKPTYPL